MADFRMPSLGSDMEAGTLVAWKRKPGDHVARGDVVAEVETDKGIIEVEIFTSGVIEKELVEEGARVPVGTALASIREDEKREEGAGAAAAAAAAPVSAAAPVAAPAAAPTPAPVAAPVRASPLARRRAAELGVDLATLTPPPHGAISVEDVERAAGEARANVEAEPRRAAAPDARMRRAIAATMSRSKREIPHFYLAHTVDLGAALAWLEARNATKSVDERVVAGVLLIRAVALAARAVPELNARWAGEEAVREEHVNVGVAISLRGGGLVAPAIHDADRLDLDALMRALVDVTARARAGSLRSSEMSDATVTLTSLGERGVDVVHPIIFPPQVAMVGAGAIRTRPWVEGGALVARPLVDLTLAVDHRVTDGHRAARFLLEMERRLARPEEP